MSKIDLLAYDEINRRVASRFKTQDVVNIGTYVANFDVMVGEDSNDRIHLYFERNPGYSEEILTDFIDRNFENYKIVFEGNFVRVYRSSEDDDEDLVAFASEGEENQEQPVENNNSELENSSETEQTETNVSSEEQYISVEEQYASVEKIFEKKLILFESPLEKWSEDYDPLFNVYSYTNLDEKEVKKQIKQLIEENKIIKFKHNNKDLDLRTRKVLAFKTPKVTITEHRGSLIKWTLDESASFEGENVFTKEHPFTRKHPYLSLITTNNPDQKKSKAIRLLNDLIEDIANGRVKTNNIYDLTQELQTSVPEIPNARETPNTEDVENEIDDEFPTFVLPQDQQHLATFQNQIFFPRKDNPLTPANLLEIVEFFESGFEWRCNLCGQDLFELSSIEHSQKEITNMGSERKDYAKGEYAANLRAYDKILGISSPDSFIPCNERTLRDVAKFVKNDQWSRIDRMQTLSNMNEYIPNVKKWMKLFVCPKCKGSIKSIPLFYTGQTIFRILSWLKLKIFSVLIGNPGDGKSEIAIKMNKYWRWKYGTPYQVVGFHAGIKQYHLAGGFHPSSLHSDTETIKYGALSRALMEGMNVTWDEINRTDVKELSFCMPFFVSPYEYEIEEANGMKFTNPNNRNDGFAKWFWIATQNENDMTNAFGKAQKSRWALVKHEYRPEQIRDIVEKSLYYLTKSERKIVEKVFQATRNWKQSGDIQFEAGIRHLKKFIIKVRNNIHQFLSYNKEQINIIYPVVDQGVLSALDSLKKGRIEIATPLQRYAIQQSIGDALDSSISRAIADDESEAKLNQVRNNANAMLPEIIELKEIDIIEGRILETIE